MHWLIVRKRRCTLKTLSVQNFMFMRVYAYINKHKDRNNFRRQIHINAHKNHINLCAHKFMRVYANFRRHPLYFIFSFCRTSSLIQHDSALGRLSSSFHVPLVNLNFRTCIMVSKNLRKKVDPCVFLIFPGRRPLLRKLSVPPYTAMYSEILTYTTRSFSPGVKKAT